MAERSATNPGAIVRGPAAGSFQPPVLKDNPTPEERAEYVVLRLEQFIRDGRTIDEGMSFRKWQQMAKVEIANAIADAENSHQKDDVVTKRLLFVAAAAMVTVGFWGTAVSMHDAGRMWGAVVIGTAGVALLAVAGEWRFRKWNKRRRAEQRGRSLARIEDLNKRIKKLEHQLEKEAESLEKELKIEL